MNIVKKIIKSKKDRIFYTEIPESTKFIFSFVINDDFKKLFCLFCSYNKEFEQNLHISVEPLENGYKLIIGRYSYEDGLWLHLRSKILLRKNIKYISEITIGKVNKILINNESSDELMQSEKMNFSHKNSEIISFGDVDNLFEKIPLSIDDFEIRKAYDGKNTCIFNVQKPKILDTKSCGIFE